MIVFIQIFVLLFIFVILCFSLLFFSSSIISAVRSLFKAGVPFVPVPMAVLESIFSELNPSSTSVVYDLGCGDGRILGYLKSREPNLSCVGIEYDAFAYMLACAKQRKNISSRFQIVCKDFYKVDISPATHVVTYLSSKVMNALLPKLERELAPGTILLSIDFAFSHKKPERVISLHRDNERLAKSLLVYKF